MARFGSGLWNRFRWLMVIAMTLLMVESAPAETIPTTPMLRLEGGMHTAIIRRLAVDGRGKIAATVSDDKTLRIWSLPDGKAIKTLRIPIGTANDGKLFAVALSPDGRLVAVGGWTGWDWEKKTTIYLLDVLTGKMVRRIGRLPNTINHLAFSPNGVFLAVAMARDNGIRIYRVQDGMQMVSDENYYDQTYWLNFDKAGQLVTTSYDGFIRLYDSSGILLRHRKFDNGKEPFSAVFSPDGASIAVGFRNSSQVEVLESRSLKTSFLPDIKGIDKKLQSVAWSKDGKYLFAAGLYQAGELRAIRRWENGGKGSFQDTPVSSDIIMDMAATPDGGLLFASGDPNLGRLDETGKLTFKHERPQADFRNMKELFRWSSDGHTFEFTYDTDRSTITRFSLDSMTLEHNSASREDLKPPLRTFNGVQVQGLKDRQGVFINNIGLPLKKMEHPSTYTIFPDGSHVLLGTNFSLRLYTKNGAELWEVPIPTQCWNVAVSQNGKVGMAAFGDGTIRWYQMQQGKEVLAFFPHNDRQRWILWNPLGYFTSSSKGDELLGWHLNQGLDNAALFYPLGQFQSRYKNPLETLRLLREVEGKSQ
ncbi:MAG: hypothetical protein G8345_11230 [Magnetococcales bacterium]|nr:hypothetical protein [Magnetococcales bacterium]NGZ27445.1 hypothetical protein [Magnetococcales bacterium]